MSFMYIAQIILNGILLGSVYALLGLGMTTIFGIVRLTNLAHGEFVIAGAFLSSVLVSALGIEPVITLLVTVPIMFVLGYILQLYLIGCAMRKGAQAAMLVTFGLSIILKDVMQLIFTADAQHIASRYAVMRIHLVGLDIPLLNVFLFVISLFTITALWLFLNKSYLGRAVRATADDPEATAICGVDIEKVHAVAMGVAMASAAVAGLCIGMKWTFYPSSGGNYLLISFVVVVIGGLGSVPGTFLAGILFGLAQVAGGANYGLLFSYIMLILILVLKPEGLFGKA